MKADLIIVFILLICLIAALLFAGIQFINAKAQISEINKYQLERCAILECDITPLGDVSCTTLHKGMDLEKQNFMLI